MQGAASSFPKLPSASRGAREYQYRSDFGARCLLGDIAAVRFASVGDRSVQRLLCGRPCIIGEPSPAPPLIPRGAGFRRLRFHPATKCGARRSGRVSAQYLAEDHAERCRFQSPNGTGPSPRAYSATRAPPLLVLYYTSLEAGFPICLCYVFRIVSCHRR